MREEKFKTYGAYVSADEELEIDKLIRETREAAPGKIRTGDAVRNIFLTQARKKKGDK